MAFRNVCFAFSFTVVAALQAPALVAGEPEAAASPPAQTNASTREDARQAYVNRNARFAPPADKGYGIDSAGPPPSLDAINEQIVRVTDGTGFGIDVAVSGTVAFIGASSSNTYQGAAYVYQRSTLCSGMGFCSWTRKQRLVASDGAAYATFGNSVAFDGTTAMIGSSNATVAGRQYQGAVYVFTRDSSNNFVQAQKLTPPDGTASDCYFGTSVAVNGDDALIGAPGCGGTNAVINSRGSAYRYHRATDGTWQIAQKLVASDGGFAEEFGSSVAITSDTAMVGANSAFQFAYYGVGAVYTFEKQCFTNGCNPGWIEKQKLIGDPTSTGMEFGTSIAFDGTSLLIGAEWALIGDEGLPLQITSGAVYAFTKTNGEWTQTQQLLASDAYRNWRFGSSIALSGNTVVVGAPGVGWPNSKGAAYLFSLSNGVWTQMQEFQASDGTNNDYYGNGVGIASTGGVVVGAPQGLNNSGQGTVYIYEGF